MKENRCEEGMRIEIVTTRMELDEGLGEEGPSDEDQILRDITTLS